MTTIKNDNDALDEEVDDEHIKEISRDSALLEELRGFYCVFDAINYLPVNVGNRVKLVSKYLSNDCHPDEYFHKYPLWFMRLVHLHAIVTREGISGIGSGK
jgi:hypothetical protein